MGGTWSNLHTSIATVSNTGVVSGLTTGLDTIIYTVTNGCGSNSVTYPIAVNTGGVSISGSSATACVGSTISFTADSLGGTWSTHHSLIDTINISGVVYGKSHGNDTVFYSVTNACGSAIVWSAITIDSLPGAFLGGQTICLGSATTFSNVIPGGTWSSLHSSIDSINITTGVDSGFALGADSVIYALTNSCGTYLDTMRVTVITLPVVASISGASAICANGTHATMTDDSTGGVWSNLYSSIDTINSNSGYVYGLSRGIDTIKYSITNACGVTTVQVSITVDTLPGMIVGLTSVCVGDSIILSDSISGGTWSRNHSLKDSITITGVVYGLAGGLDTISYSVTSLGCGTNSAKLPITINTVPVLTAITGSSTVCIGGTITLSNSTSGGVWSTHNTIHDSVSATGVVHGITRGTDTVFYAVTNTCGTTIVNKLITGDTLPSSITGLSSVCVGATISLANTTSGGTWSNVHSANDSVSSSGVVHGIATGTDTIKYTLVNGCGTNVAKAVITINTIPTVAPITGIDTFCAGTTNIFADSTIGGVWSNHYASVDSINASTGVAHGISNGNDTIYYSVTNGCGTTIAKRLITVDSIKLPGIISGFSGVCVGSTIYLSESVSGGTWSHSNHAVDTLHGLTYGIVKGLAAGTDVISYTVHSTCGTSVATFNINIDTLNAGTIIGLTDSVCSGLTIQLADSATGGIWMSGKSRPNTASTVN